MLILTKMGVISRILVLIIFTILACDNIEFSTEDTESFVTVSFIDIDSVNRVNNNIQVLNDSLTAVNQRIANGEMGLENIVVALEDEISDLDSIALNLQNGYIQVDNISAIGSNGVLIFNELDSVYKLPLDINTDQTILLITIDSRIDSLGISYFREVVEKDDKLLFELTNTRITFHSYDSAAITCDSLCISNEAKIKAYF